MTESAKFRSDAQELLEETGILRLLGKYGKVELTGSYVLDLMMSPDIDIHMASHSMTKDKVVSLFNELIEQGQFQSCTLGDNTRKREKEFPRGYYIGLKKPLVDDRWKIDVWCLKRGGYNKKAIEFVRSHLDSKKKLAILKLKKWKYSRNAGFPSVKIYEAVIR